MWSPVVLALIVGIASCNAFQQGNEYVYRVYGRTLTGLEDLSNKYSGILYKSTLSLIRTSENEFAAQITDAQYSPFQAALPGGWESDIPESQLQYKPFPSIQKPFKIVMQDGVFQDLIVESEMTNVEANVIRSIVSNIQLDTQGKNIINSRINQKPQEGSNSAVYKTMEQSVTGRYETLYEINPLPSAALSYQPWLAPWAAKEGQEVIEITKHKNYSNAQDLVELHFGLSDLKGSEPATNSMGDFFSRSAVSRAIVTGNLKEYIIQSSVTVNQVILSPTLTNADKGSVVSYMNLTLAHVQPSQGAPSISNPKSLGTLIYRYDNPFSKSKHARTMSKDSQDDYVYGDINENSYNRKLRSSSLKSDKDSSAQWESSEERFEEGNQDEFWVQERIPVNKQPNIPLLPYFVGYEGKSVKFAKDTVNRVQSLAKEIAQELQQRETISKHQTLSKYVILVNLIRLMEANEIERVKTNLYAANAEQGANYDAWTIYRDAVSEAGTGPAFLAVRNWIITKAVRGNDAATLVSSVVHTTTIPSDEYMKLFYDFVFNKEVQDEPVLNASAILSYSELVNRVYVSKEDSHNEYPVHAFGSFRTKQGKEFVQNTYLPRLGKRLDEAVAQGDATRIHIYIKALTLVGHPEILSYFQPYLEGEKPMSTYQRYLIVSNLNELGNNHPKTALSVLYKIYQNPGEASDVRIAAVYQLMRVNPPASMLQRMAEYTNMETNEQLNAAVKSSIMSAASLHGKRHSSLKYNARAAVPLLTTKNYETRYPFNGMFAEGDRSSAYLQTLSAFDGYIPRDVRFSLHHRYGELNHKSFSLRHSISSLSRLFSMFEKKKPILSDLLTLYLSLGLKIEEPEQVEGNFDMRFGTYHRFFSYDNHTIEQLPQLLQQLQEQLKQGHPLHYTKFINRAEQVISFPTETGLPFVYTVNRPTVMTATVKESSISMDADNWRQSKVEGQAQVEILFATKIEGQLSFITPFDHQQYSSGYERTVQVYLPLQLKASANPRMGNVKFEIQFQQPQKNTGIFKYKSVPYTSKSDILDLQPIMNSPQTQVIRKHPSNPTRMVVGKELAFRVSYDNEDKYMDYGRLYQLFKTKGISEAAVTAFTGEGARYSSISIDYAGDVSRSTKVVIRAGKLLLADYNKDDTPYQQHHSIPEMSSELQPISVAQRISEGISSAVSRVYYASASFDSQESNKYVALLGISSSPISEQSRIWLELYKSSRVAPAYVRVSVRSFTPIPGEMEVLYNLKHDLSGNSTVEMEVSSEGGQPAKIRADIDMLTTQENKEQLKQQPQYQQCQAQIQQGNYQLPACANVSAMASEYDKYRVGVQYENLSPELYNGFLQVYNLLRHYYYINSNESYLPSSGARSNQVEFEVDYDAQKQKVDVNVTSQTYRADFQDILIDGAVRKADIMNYLMGNADLRTCSYDKNALNTFDNRTFDMTVNDKYILMMFYAVHIKDINHWKGQNDYYKVEVKADANGDKQVKISVGLYEAIANVVMKRSSLPGSSAMARVSINGKDESIYADKVNYFFKGFINIYPLPRGELKVSIKNAFDVVYDGHRVQVVLTNPKFYESLRGVCGNYNEEPADDFIVPNNCIVSDSQVFVDSYTLSYPPSGYPPKTSYKNCAPHKKVQFARVISDMDTRRNRPWRQPREQGQYRMQTRYEEIDGSICFTVQKQPSCWQGKTTGYTTKKAAVHCLSPSRVTEMWKSRIDEGHSPDFSPKSISKYLDIKVPVDCRRE